LGESGGAIERMIESQHNKGKRERRESLSGVSSYVHKPLGGLGVEVERRGVLMKAERTGAPQISDRVGGLAARIGKRSFNITRRNSCRPGGPDRRAEI